MLDVLASGYPSLDSIFATSHSPGVGETALLQSSPAQHRPEFGGCGANVAVALSLLGFKAGVAMVVGDDEAGQDYVGYLQQRGVDTQDVTVLSGHHTSQSLLFRNPDGEYQNFFFAGAADAWDGELTLKNADRVHYGLITVDNWRHNMAFVAQLFNRGVPLIWQLKPDIAAFPEKSAAEFARKAAVILMNHIEATYLLKAMHLTDVAALIGEQTHTVVVTNGKNGATVYTSSGSTHVPAIAGRIVDTTGAGDGFTAGFIAGLLQKREAVICAQMGAIVASFVLEKIGCQTNLPSWDAMVSRYKIHSGDL
ncbi:MAG: PfkB family carbohydrate kinase [Chloroflexota bacterium]